MRFNISSPSDDSRLLLGAEVVAGAFLKMAVEIKHRRWQVQNECWRLISGMGAKATLQNCIMTMPTIY